MKKFIALAFGFCAVGSVAMAQTLESKYGLDSIKTLENASVYSEFVKQKNYKDALPSWRYVFNNAPAFQLNTYLRGEDIMTNMFLQTKEPAYLDSLMMVYDQWIKYFGKHPRLGEGFALGKKGTSLARLGGKDNETLKKAYGYMVKSFEMEGANTHPVAIKIMFHTSGDLLKKELLTKEEYINFYMKVTEHAENMKKTAPKPEVFEDVKATVDALFFDAGVADCNTLNTLLTAKYEANKEDINTLKEISSLLRRRECLDLPLYATVAEQLYKQDPNAESAYSLSVMFLRRKDVDKAEAYLKEAIDKSTDNSSKADYYLRMSQIKLSKGQLQATKSNALEALKLNPNLGQAYINIGRAYAEYSKNYGEDNFDHQSVFWAAVDKFLKAKQVDPSVAEDADKFITAYSAYFPSKEEAFFRSITAGATVKVGDWINESTTARFR